MTETKRPESRSYCKGECGRRHPSRMDREMSAAKDARRARERLPRARRRNRSS